jgi:hypothetical protein
MPDRFEELATELLAMLRILVDDRHANAVPEDLTDPTTSSAVVSTEWMSEEIAIAAADDQPVMAFVANISQGRADRSDDASAATETIAEAEASVELLAVQPGTPDAESEPAEAACQLEPPHRAAVLHVGCGAYDRDKLPPVFRETGWREIRLDIDPAVRPDFVASITHMEIVSDGSIDAVYSSHNIEHLYPHEVPLALREMHRVLNSAGFALLRLPDLQEVARYIAEGNLEQPLYTSPMGAISPLDILYGHRVSLAAGNVYMSHRTGFTGGTLGTALIQAGFAAAMVQRDQSTFSLAAVAFRTMPPAEQIARTQALILPDPYLPAILYTAPG